MPVETLPQLLFDAVGKHCHPKAFQRKVNGVYEAVSAATFAERCLHAALGLRDCGLIAGDRVAILGRSSVNWALADFAVQLLGAVSVPIYPSLPAEAVGKLLAHAGVRAAFVEDAGQAAKLVGASGVEVLKVIVQFGGQPGAGVMALADLEAAGAKAGAAATERLRQESLRIPGAADSTLIYTSGTSGDPKGVLLSHRNLVSDVQAALAVVPLRADDVALSCLPLSHLLERTAGLHAMFAAGVSIAYAESFDTIATNLLEVRPTVMLGVPRLYEKLYARVQSRAAAGGYLRRRAFAWARGAGHAWTASQLGGAPTPLGLRAVHAVADRLVFAQVRARTGGRLRFFISGGAPLAPEIASFFYAAGLPILEGYGLTETSPIISVNSLAAPRVGSVGRALPGVEVRIAADGEILTRGPHVMRGYFRDEAATRAAIDPDGWFATGDIGELDAEGCLRITDRKKDLLVTAGGKNVAPQPIESRFKQDRFIAECILIGDGRPFIAALFVPEFAGLRGELERRGIAVSSPADLVGDPRALAYFQERVDRLNAGLPRHEQVRGWRLLDHDLSLDAGELTPSLKVRRRRVLERYAELVETIYSGTGRPATAPPR